MKFCSVLGCCRPYKCKGLCSTHYMANLRITRKQEGWSVQDEESFWSKVFKSPGCWEWLAMVDKGGYGSFSVNAYPVKAHRFSWILHNGKIPEGLGVLHKCDNPRCVNPDHLFLGTNVANTADRDAKGRQSKGEKHPDAKLTEEQVREIRIVYKAGSRRYGIRPLARAYGLSKSTMASVVNRLTWKEVQ